jgi:predicted RNase H-like HicB family nuclease
LGEEHGWRLELLAQYVGHAMTKARYERLTFGWLGYVPEFDGVWVLEETQKACEQELVNAMEHWLKASYRQGLPIPVVDGMDIAALWDEIGAPEHEVGR